MSRFAAWGSVPGLDAIPNSGLTHTCKWPWRLVLAGMVWAFWLVFAANCRGGHEGKPKMVLLACALIAASSPGLLGAAPQIAAPQITALPVATSLLAAPVSPGGTGAGDGATAPAATRPSVGPSAAPVAEPAGVSAGAAPAPAVAPVAAPDSDTTLVRDPWEHTNRAVFSFDTSLDKHLLGPVSRGYTAVLPGVLRHHLSQVIANLDEPITIANNLLQLRMDAFGKSLMRFTINSTVGLAGIFDVASHHKLEHHDADFGQTLGRWGAKPGAFVMLPLLGPSNVRDSIGRVVDLVGDPVSWLFGGITTTFGGSREGTELIDSRAQAEPMLRAVYDSTDPYATERSGYMQWRAATVREATGKVEALPDFDTP